MKITFNNKALKLETLEVSNFESVTGFVPLKVWLESKTCQLFPYQVVLGGGRRHFVPKVALDRSTSKSICEYENRPANIET